MSSKLSLIKELESIRKLKSQLNKRENELTRPILSDLSMVQEIYGWFVQILSERDCPPNPESVIQRKKFLFIIMAIFCPKSLVGGKLSHGVRSELAKVFPKLNPCVISHNIADVSFMFQHYRDFRQDIESIYSEILEKMEKSFEVYSETSL